MKRKLTPEQESKRAERRAQFQGLVKRLGSMDDSERARIAAQMPGLVTVDGHALSLHNTLLMALQNPGATMVGGFRQWLKHGRSVRKGERGSMIWVPIGQKRAETDSNGSDSTHVEGDVHFIAGTVFDIGQTDEVNARYQEI